MKKNNLLALTILAAALSTPLAYADANTVTPAQKKEIETIVHDYLIAKPEVLIEASQALQKKQQALMQEQAKSAIAQNGSALVSGTLTIGGNPKGDVTLVEFFDYQCAHCVRMKPIINNLIKKNPNLRVVFKEFPIFGKESELASRVAIVAAMQGKYMKFQDGLFKADKQHLDEETIMAVAKKAGLNMKTLKTDIQAQNVTDLLEESHKLAESVHLMGTPAFIVLSTPNGQFKPGMQTAFIPGAAQEDTIQELIDKMAKNQPVK